MEETYESIVGEDSCGRRHFCTCTDTACPCNPNNPVNRAKGRGCDACIRKNLQYGEVPSCIFKSLGSTEDWHDYSVEGFARFVADHPRDPEVKRRCAEASAAFEAAHQK